MNDETQPPNEDETPPAVERALRALAGLETEDGLPAPADERLRAYREGTLSEDATKELERELARSAAGRRRLLELAGVDHSLPLRRVRRAVLGAAGPRRRTAPWLAAAALAASIVLAVLTLFPHHASLPAGLAYDVGAHGLAETRAAGGEVRSEARAYPDTPLRIQAVPRGESPAGVSFALFRLQDGSLSRVRVPDEARVETDRGSAVFTGTAGTVLATRSPGVYPLYVIAYPHGTPPPAYLRLEPGQDPAAALRSSGRLVYPVTVVLLRAE
jgi:hypothetical protein